MNNNNYCEGIISLAIEVCKDSSNRTICRISLPISDIIVRLYHNKEGSWCDFCEYCIAKTGISCFTFSTPELVYNTFNIKPINYNVLSFSRGKDEKLAKPTELKGIKQNGSVDFIKGKCKCPFYILGNDIYIKHNDYFSPSYIREEDIGTPLSYRCEKYGVEKKVGQKFIYEDSWGDIVLRQTAWIKIENVLPYLKIFNLVDVSNAVLREIERFHNFKEYSLDFYWRDMIYKLLLSVNKSQEVA